MSYFVEMRYPYFRKYEEENLYFSVMAKALSHPARVANVRFLYDRGEGDVSTLVDLLPLSRATVSEHLRVLRAVGFISGKEEGKRVRYRIERRTVGIFGKGVESIEAKKRGVLARGGKRTPKGGEDESWFEGLPLSSRPGPYSAAKSLGGIG
jgi:ArsR family transcriptional regulator